MPIWFKNVWNANNKNVKEKQKPWKVCKFIFIISWALFGSVRYIKWLKECVNQYSKHEALHVMGNQQSAGWRCTAAVRCNTEITDRCKTTIQYSICTLELRSTNNKPYLTKASHLKVHSTTSNKLPSMYNLLTNEREKKGIPEIFVRLRVCALLETKTL
jgi:hypothetical protein